MAKFFSTTLRPSVVYRCVGFAVSAYLIYIGIASGSIAKDSASAWDATLLLMRGIGSNWTSIAFGTAGVLVLIASSLPWKWVLSKCRKPAHPKLAWSTDPEAVAKRQESMNRAMAAAENAKRLLRYPSLDALAEKWRPLNGLDFRDYAERDLNARKEQQEKESQKETEPQKPPAPEASDKPIANSGVKPRESMSASIAAYAESSSVQDVALNSEVKRGGIVGAKALIEKRIRALPAVQVRGSTWGDWLDETGSLFTSLVKTRLKTTWMNHLRAIPHGDDLKSHLYALRQAKHYLEGIKNNLSEDDLR